MCDIEREEILALFNAWAPTYLKDKDITSWRDRAILPFDAFCAGYKLAKKGNTPIMHSNVQEAFKRS